MSFYDILDLPQTETGGDSPQRSSVAALMAHFKSFKVVMVKNKKKRTLAALDALQSNVGRSRYYTEQRQSLQMFYMAALVVLVALQSGISHSR